MNLVLQRYGTGGNCEALFCELDGVSVLITDFSGTRLPQDGQPFLFGFYKSDDVCGQELAKFEGDDYSNIKAIEFIKKHIGSAINNL